MVWERGKEFRKKRIDSPASLPPPSRQADAGDSRRRTGSQSLLTTAAQVSPIPIDDIFEPQSDIPQAPPETLPFPGGTRRCTASMHAPGPQRNIVSEGTSVLKSRVVAHQGNDEAVMRFEDKTVLRPVDRDAMHV